MPDLDLPGIRARDANDDPGYETLATAADIRKQDRRALLQLVDQLAEALREALEYTDFSGAWLAETSKKRCYTALALVDGARREA